MCVCSDASQTKVEGSMTFKETRSSSWAEFSRPSQPKGHITAQHFGPQLEPKFPCNTLTTTSALAKARTLTTTPQPEIITKLIPKTLFYVTEMGFCKEIIPKQNFHVIL